MSQKYSFRVLELAAASQKEREKEQPSKNQLRVFEIGETRTIDFILLDGTRQNFAYGHYMTAWLGKDEGERVIKIFFATHMVTICGSCLDEIYTAILSQSLKTVIANDERYLGNVKEGQSFVTNIKILWNSERNIS